MAEEVNIDINLEGSGEAIKTVKDLKKQFAEAEDAVFALAGAGKEGTAEFRRAQLEAAKLKERVDDINESLDQLKPEAVLGSFSQVATGLASGFSAATAATALFGDESEELGKQLVKVQAAMAFAEGLKGLGALKDGFKNLGVVIRANPLFLIVGLAASIGTALFALKDKIPIVSKAFDFLGGAVNKAVQFFKDVGDAIGLSNFATQKAIDLSNEHARTVIANNEKVLASYTRSIDEEIRLRAANGEQTIELEKKKNEKIIESANKRIAQLSKLQENANSEQYEENKKQIAELIILAREAANANDVIDIAEAKRKRDLAKENFKKLLDLKKQFAEKEKEFARQKAADEKLIEDEKQKALDDALLKRFEANIGYIEKTSKQIDIDNQEQIDKEKALADAKAQIRMDSFNILNNLAQTFINNSKKLEQFNKASALTQIAIDTALAISALVKASQQNVANGATLGAAGIAQFTQGLVMITANIVRAKQLLSGGGTASPTFSTPRGSGGNIQSGVNITPLRSTTSTVIDSESVEGGQGVIRAYVVENDITSKQNSINNIIKKSKI